MVGPGPRLQPLGEAASAGSTGGTEEPLTLLSMEQQPCWATGTKFTLFCSFKTIAGQGGRVDAPQFGPGARACPRRTQHKGTLPTAGNTAQPERYRGSGLK